MAETQTRVRCIICSLEFKLGTLYGSIATAAVMVLLKTVFG